MGDRQSHRDTHRHKPIPFPEAAVPFLLLAHPFEGITKG